MNTLIRLLAAYAVAAVAVIIAAGFIGAAAMAWLGPLVGFPLAGLIVALAFVLIMILALAYASYTRNEHPAKSNPVAAPALSVFNSHPMAVMAGTGLLAFLLTKKPGLLLRMGTLGAAAASLLKDFHDDSRRRGR